MGQLEDMAMFARIVDAGGIGKAAEQLDIAKSAVSRRLSDLEKRLGTQLLHRTTRSYSLTDAGLIYYQRTQNILDDVSELNEMTAGSKAHVEGILKISAPLSFGLMHLSPLIDDYAREYGELGFQIDFSDRQVDLVEEGYELAIRIGTLNDSSYQARRITRIKHVLCASPVYLEKVGLPASPEDLDKHPFLQYGLSNNENIKINDQSGNQFTVAIRSKMIANNGDFLKQMALQGHGVTYLPTFLTYNELTNGSLVALLDGYQLPEMNAYAIYPRNRYLPERCRRFIDFLVQKFGDQPCWDKR